MRPRKHNETCETREDRRKVIVAFREVVDVIVVSQHESYSSGGLGLKSIWCTLLVHRRTFTTASKFRRLHVRGDSRQARAFAVQISCVEVCRACCRDDLDVSGYPGLAPKQLLEHGNRNEASRVSGQEPYPRPSHQID
jgi:hypothetical protein